MLFVLCDLPSDVADGVVGELRASYTKHDFLYFAHNANTSPFRGLPVSHGHDFARWLDETLDPKRVGSHREVCLASTVGDGAKICQGLAPYFSTVHVPIEMPTHGKNRLENLKNQIVASTRRSITLALRHFSIFKRVLKAESSWPLLVPCGPRTTFQYKNRLLEIAFLNKPSASSFSRSAIEDALLEEIEERKTSLTQSNWNLTARASMANGSTRPRFMRNSSSGAASCWMRSTYRLGVRINKTAHFSIARKIGDEFSHFGCHKEILRWPGACDYELFPNNFLRQATHQADNIVGQSL